MNRYAMIMTCGMVIFSTTALSESTQPAQELFKRMSMLEGEWALSAADQQEGKATQHKLVKPLVGTPNVAMSFKVIGKGTTIQENLLPNNGKEMATMYRCDKAGKCNKLLATHFCAKQNQPELIADAGADDRSISFSCDMSTELCQSNDGHVHRISHQLIDDNHLKTTYTIYKNGKFEKDSIYHFERTTPETASLAALELAREDKTGCPPANKDRTRGSGSDY